MGPGSGDRRTSLGQGKSYRPSEDGGDGMASRALPACPAKPAASGGNMVSFPPNGRPFSVSRPLPEPQGFPRGPLGRLLLLAVQQQL